MLRYHIFGMIIGYFIWFTHHGGVFQSISGDFLAWKRKFMFLLSVCMDTRQTHLVHMFETMKKRSMSKSIRTMIPLSVQRLILTVVMQLQPSTEGPNWQLESASVKSVVWELATKDCHSSLEHQWSIANKFPIGPVRQREQSPRLGGNNLEMANATNVTVSWAWKEQSFSHESSSFLMVNHVQIWKCIRQLIGACNFGKTEILRNISNRSLASDQTMFLMKLGKNLQRTMR